MFTNPIYIKSRTYIALAIIIGVFILSYGVPFLFGIAKTCLAGLGVLILIDWYLLYNSLDSLDGKRVVDEKLSLSDEQMIRYEIKRHAGRGIKITLVDELPYQFQHRNVIDQFALDAESSKTIDFPIRPTVRGIFQFGQLSGIISNFFPGFIEIKKVLAEAEATHVYPSIIQMRKFELQLASRTAHLQGIKKVRIVGENDEFEHIRNYVQGDNIKSINWKATSRNQNLMVNQYQDSRSQMVYCLVDKGRAMKMPFFNMTLLDHSINTALIISNIILKKYDKAGLLTFSNKIGAIVKATSHSSQLEHITEKLYAQQTNFLESNFELLYYTIRKSITRRSILLLFTNFEQPVDVDRHLKYLKAISKIHLLIIIIFENTEMNQTATMEVETKSDIYFKTFARKTLVDKERIRMRLESNGIQCILTKPEDLPVHVINKYLEIKSKRMT